MSGNKRFELKKFGAPKEAFRIIEMPFAALKEDSLRIKIEAFGLMCANQWLQCSLEEGGGPERLGGRALDESGLHDEAGSDHHEHSAADGELSSKALIRQG